ncbi:DUF935 family protein [Streptomyces sp. NPDC058469]|uniref:phage portal protein family protein n=1 Tax=Streptomyces sp. NPDC058469 TaxID=3346514 RepID=UPI00366317AA
MDTEAQKIEAAAKTAAQYGELGRSGTLIFSGIITGEEYSSDLTGHQAVVVYDKMRRGDATVRASLAACYLPIEQAQWEFDAASDDPIDQDVAEFCDEVFIKGLNWHGFISEALTFLPFGFSVFEMVFGMKKVNGKDRIVITKLAFRKQKTIYKWTSDKYGEGITQMIADGSTPEIPWSKLVVFTNQKEGDNHEGISVLRSAYKHWFIKDTLYQIDSVAHERHALGVIDITEPEQADDKDRQKLITGARNLRANAQSYVNHKVGWTVGFMDMKAGTLRDMKPSIDHHDRQIAKNTLTQFLELGSNSSGSRSLSEDHSAFFTLAEKSTAQIIIDTLMQTAVKTVVDLNFTVDKYPQLKATGLDDQNITLFSDAYEKIVGAGGIVPTDEDENFLRSTLGMADKAEGATGRKPTDKAKPKADVKKETAPVPEDKTKAAIVRANQLYDELTEAHRAQRAA